MQEASEVSPYPKRPKGEKINNNALSFNMDSTEPKSFIK